MKLLAITAVLATVIGCAASPALAKEGADEAVQPQQISSPMSKRDYLFEEQAGTWKATCNEMEDGKVYCRVFHIEQFGEWKTKNFVQLGLAWSPDAVGFVIATYLGFKEGTSVSIGIDKQNRHKLTAPKGNNLMISPESTEKILKEMESGHKIVITFNSYSGVRHLSMADLTPFQMLLAKVNEQMAKNAK